jgi:N-acetylneuraminic acid mutarotase
MLTKRYVLSTSVVTGKIYAIGGAITTHDPGLSIVEEYDPVTDVWTTKSPMPTARVTFLSTCSFNDIIYVIGGMSVDNCLSNIETFDPETDAWNVEDPMPLGRGFLSTCSVGGKIYAIGGSPRNTLVQEYTPPE